MEAWKKWWKEVNIPHVPTCEDTACSRETWRAVLEMVLTQMDEDRFKDNGELRTFIEQELENN